jgi:uncharacterized membrane protein YjjP (DUF1212 family)
VIVSFGRPEEMRTTLLRVEPAGIDLAGMSRIDELIDALSAGRIDVTAAARARRPRARPSATRRG